MVLFCFCLPLWVHSDWKVAMKPSVVSQPCRLCPSLSCPICAMFFANNYENTCTSLWRMVDQSMLFRMCWKWECHSVLMYSCFMSPTTLSLFPSFTEERMRTVVRSLPASQHCLRHDSQHSPHKVPHIPMCQRTGSLILNLDQALPLSLNSAPQIIKSKEQANCFILEPKAVNAQIEWALALFHERIPHDGTVKMATALPSVLNHKTT